MVHCLRDAAIYCLGQCESDLYWTCHSQKANSHFPTYYYFVHNCLNRTKIIMKSFIFTYFQDLYTISWLQTLRLTCIFSITHMLYCCCCWMNPHGFYWLRTVTIRSSLKLEIEQNHPMHLQKIRDQKRSLYTFVVAGWIHMASIGYVLSQFISKTSSRTKSSHALTKDQSFVYSEQCVHTYLSQDCVDMMFLNALYNNAHTSLGAHSTKVKYLTATGPISFVAEHTWVYCKHN